MCTLFVAREGGDLTERKPNSVGFETWIEAQINKARKEGAFDHIEGRGKPLPDLDKPTSPDWWVNKWIKREKLQAILPDTLALKRDVSLFLEDIQSLRSEDVVRKNVHALNVRIAHCNARPAKGPPSTVSTLDVEQVVRRWKSQRRVA